MKYSFVFFIAVMLGSLFFVKVAEAAPDNDLCICQTGTMPARQVGFFKLGCRIWHIGKSCRKKMTVSFDKSLDEILTKNPTAKKVKLSYVGHWSSAEESVEFLGSTIVPLIRKHDVSFTIDNTACLATNNPFVIVNYLKTMTDVAGRIQFKGNQAVSTGLWDKALSGRNNFWAKISGENLDVTFPKCREFESKGCAGAYQAKGTGVCLDEDAGKHVFLRCEEGVRTVTRLDPGGKRTSRVKEKYYSWKRFTQDLQLRSYGSFSTVWAGYDNFTFTKTEEAERFISEARQDAALYLKHLADQRVYRSENP